MNLTIVMTSVFMESTTSNDSKVTKLKLAVLGDKQVGKSSLLTRYTRGTFNPIYIHTKGGDIATKKVKLNGISMHLSMIDSAGHRYVRSLIKTLYRNVHGIMLVYDVTREHTFESMKEWLQQIEMVNTNNPFIVLVGNKSDLHYHKTVPYERAAQFAAQEGISHFEVSAKTGSNVSEAFKKLIEGTYSEKLPGTYILDSICLTEKKTEEEEDQCCGS